MRTEINLQNAGLGKQGFEQMKFTTTRFHPIKKMATLHTSLAARLCYLCLHFYSQGLLLILQEVEINRYIIGKHIDPVSTV
jgi:hypothetical protein